MRLLTALLLIIGSGVLSGSPPPALAQPVPACRFVLGFQSLHDLIPAIVGDCLTDEQHNPVTGDALQPTITPPGTAGLLVWRKADNWTAFTDGYRSWINGPNGLQERLNTERFAWEANPDGLPVLGAPPVAGSDWPSYHHDATRRGAAADTPGGPVQQLWQSPLDGQLYAEPVVAGSRVFVATEDDTVYALDVARGDVLWRAHLGDPVPGASLPCGDIDPVGITGTPVLDTARGRLYVAAFVQPERNVLFALDLTTGATLWQRPLDPPGSDPAIQGQRGALALANGTVYVPFGGRDYDCGAYHGLVVGVPADGTGPLVTYQTPTAAGGGIWAPGGIAVGSSGNLYVATGNGGSTTFDYSDSIIKLSPSLTPLDYFAPRNWQELSRDDVDLGSIAPVLLGNGLLFQAGKAGIGYLVATGQLGQIGGEAFSARVCSSGVFGAAAYAAPYLYVPCRDGVVALQVNAAAPSFAVAWRSAGFRAGAPIVAGGMVWSVSRDGTLFGLDPGSGQRRQQLAVGGFATSFPTLAASAGRLFVPAGSSLLAFGPGGA